MREIIYSNAGKLSAHMICSGWDPYKGFQIYEVNSYGFFQTGDFAISGSGGVFVRGFFDANFKPDMSIEEAKAFLKKCISLACYRDGSSGGIIRMIEIRENGVERSFIPYNDFDI